MSITVLKSAVVLASTGCFSETSLVLKTSHALLFSFFPWLLTQLRPLGGWQFVSITISGSRVSCLLILLHIAHGSLVMQFTYCFCVQIWKHLKSLPPYNNFVFPHSSLIPFRSYAFSMALCHCGWASVGGKEMGGSNVLCTLRRVDLGCVYLG